MKDEAKKEAFSRIDSPWESNNAFRIPEGVGGLSKLGPKFKNHTYQYWPC